MGETMIEAIANMGTRADFYIGTGETAEWLGSIAYDGYPDGLPEDVIKASTEEGFRAEVAELAKESHWTSPEQGWPWPWNDSHTTDWAYAFKDGVVLQSCFGCEWHDAKVALSEEQEEALKDKAADVPDMSAQKNVTLGPRSGNAAG